MYLQMASAKGANVRPFGEVAGKNNVTSTENISKKVKALIKRLKTLGYYYILYCEMEVATRD